MPCYAMNSFNNKLTKYKIIWYFNRVASDFWKENSGTTQEHFKNVSILLKKISEFENIITIVFLKKHNLIITKDHNNLFNNITKDLCRNSRTSLIILFHFSLFLDSSNGLAYFWKTCALLCLNAYKENQCTASTEKQI